MTKPLTAHLHQLVHANHPVPVASVFSALPNPFLQPHPRSYGSSTLPSSTSDDYAIACVITPQACYSPVCGLQDSSLLWTHEHPTPPQPRPPHATNPPFLPHRPSMRMQGHRSACHSHPPFRRLLRRQRGLLEKFHLMLVLRQARVRQMTPN